MYYTYVLVSVNSMIAQLIVEALETTILSKIKFHIPFFYRYVMAISVNRENFVLDKFNSYCYKFQFPIGKAPNKQINFPGMTLIQLHAQDVTYDIIKTKWFYETNVEGQIYKLYFKPSPIPKEV